MRKQIVCAAGAVALAGGVARGAEQYWVNPAGGATDVPGNWQGGIAPSTGDRMVFKLGSGAPYTVTYPGSPTGMWIRVTNDNVVLDLGGNVFGLPNTETAILLGDSTGPARLTIRNGTLLGPSTSFGGLRVGASGGYSDYTDHLTFTGVRMGGWPGGKAGTIYVGDFNSTSTGVLTFNGGSSFSAISAYVGNYGTGTMLLADAGTRLALSNLTVGGYGGSIGNVQVTGGAELTTAGSGSAGVKVGDSGAVGAVRIAGAGSSWSTSYATFGYSGAGSLVVEDGGAFDAGTPAYPFETTTFAYETNAQGELQVKGAGSTFRAGALVVGRYGQASASVSDGAVASVYSASLASYAGSRAVMTVTGAGSALNVEGAPPSATRGLFLGMPYGTGGSSIGGAATLTVSDGAAVNNAFATVVGSGSSLRVKRATVSTGTMVVNAGGLLRLDDGVVSVGSVTNGGEIALAGPEALVIGVGPLTNNRLVRGNGRITLALSNGMAGEVRVAAGERLTFAFPGGFTGAPANTNGGRLTLLGGELEFAGALANNSTGTISGRGTLSAGSLANAGGMTFSGDSDVLAPLTNSGNARVTLTNDATVTFFQPVVHGETAEFRLGAGTRAVFLADVTGAGAFTGEGTAVFAAGSPTLGAVETAGDVEVAAATQLSVASVSAHGVSVDAGGTMVLRAGGGESVVSSLSIAPGGRLDVTDNTLVIDYAEGAASPVAAVRAAIASAYGAGRWDGAGITTSSAAMFDGAASLGYADDGGAVTVRFTWVGDANLDGVVNAADAARVGTGGGWGGGDFNYDGRVTADDYALLALGATVGTLNISTVVPEPSMAAYAALCCAGIGRRGARRRRGREASVCS